MNNVISVGLVEQKEYPNGMVSDPGALNKVTHVEYKHLNSIGKSHKAVTKYDQDMLSLLHVQYYGEDEEGTLNLVDPNFREKLDGIGLDKIIGELNPRWISFHLGFAAEKLITGGQHGHDVGASPILEKEEIKKRIIDNIAYVKKNYKGVDILLENLDYYPFDESKGAYDHVTDPEFMTEVINKTDTYLLLDLAHAEIRAKNKGEKPEEYINKLPLEQVVEMHLTKTGKKDGKIIDSHENLTDTKLFEYVLNTGRLENLKAVSLETFSDVGPQLGMIKDALRKNNQLILEDVVKPEYYFDLKDFEHKSVFDGVKYVWNSVNNIGDYIENYLDEKISNLEKDRRIEGTISENNVVIEGLVDVEEGAVIEPFTVIKGNVRIGKGTTIKSNTKIEGNVWIGENTTIDNAVIYGNNIIGNHCDIRPGAYIRGNSIFGNHVEFRSESKNSMVMNKSAAAHYAYLGDSIIGSGVNFGAGTKTGNLKINYTPVVVDINGWKFDIGGYKLGAIVGDNTSTSCDTEFNPGASVGRWVLASGEVRGFVPFGSFVKPDGTIIPRKPETRPTFQDMGKFQF